MQVYRYLSNSAKLQEALQHSLPYSINLVYRTQHTNQTEHAHVLATFPPESESVPKCWAAAYIDRSMRPETELWMFAAGEIPNHSPTDDFCQNCKRAVLQLLDHMSTLSTPPMRSDNQQALEIAHQHEREQPSPGPDGTYLPTQGIYMRHLLLAKVILMGGCHEQVIQICREADLIRKDFPGHDLELNKFLFKISDLPATKKLPEGLRWGEVREQDIAIVRARTSIPRTAKTLLSLKSVGVFEEKSDRAVAWTFLGLDGSLTTLHTEQELRGKGIAKAVAARIIRKHAPGLAVDGNGDAWSHADVYVDNVQSAGVCRSLGGKALWKDYWVRLDLDKAGSLAGGA
ncbi:hypothetical protein BKA63DRAFT_511239 [Paraphoma chrysanthemicola]|nr:hypothetical protein BKA63DRAFT_511239 [Paraphoma chrysanthemicola]